MLTYRDKALLLDGKPALIMAGEVHYFRLPPVQWQDRIDRLKEAGMNAVAIYVPWVLHEYRENEFDLDGHTNPRLNLAGFLALCQENGLYIFLRPGPFIMAEMKNDGIPFWVYENHPETIPQGFDGEVPTTPTLDYLSPAFLRLAQKWYKEIIGLATRFMPHNGGKLIAVQLDNEIGMLPWVSNKPDLTTRVLDSFMAWLAESFDAETLAARYPFVLDTGAHPRFVSPQPPYDVCFHRDFGRYSRERFRTYVQLLRGYAIEAGAQDVLYVVNIHGTGGGRGFTYPIGVSQLLETYSAPDDIIAGSDVYFDNLEIRTLADMYLCNGITDCTNLHGKPLTSVEFSCGDSNFGDDFSNRNRASANDLKTRLFLAQGNRLFNFYLFSGGENMRLSDSIGDGNDRSATTGETHGFAAPIGPYGVPNYTFPRMARVNRQIMALSAKLATAEMLYDDTAYAFIPDDYMTEYVYKKSEAAVALYKDLERNRTGNVWEASVRAMLLSGLAPQTADIQRFPIGEHVKHLIVPCAKHMQADMQRKLLVFIENGGSVLFHGRIPRWDDENNPCTILADALETSGYEEHAWRYRYDAEVEPCGFLAGGNAYNCGALECFDVRNAEVILRKYDGGKAVGSTRKSGAVGWCSCRWTTNVTCRSTKKSSKS